MKRPALLLALFIMALSAAYAAAMFRGLEHHSAYFGNAYQALHPGSFPGDPFMDPARPTMISLYYGFVRLAGPLWLDDRFTLFLFFLMTAISLLALDRTARLMGIGALSERAAIIALLLIEHRFFLTQILLVDHYEFNATALAGPFILWLLYGALAGWRIPFQILLMALAMAVSPKNSWLAAGIALALIFRFQLSPRAKAAALGILAAVAAFGLSAYALWVRSPDGTDAALFNYILERMDDVEANPFLYPFWVNALFAGLCLAGWALRGLPPLIHSKIKTVSAVGLLAWFFGGLYLTAAPDFLKIPHLVPFDVARALRWPSYLIYLALGVRLLKRYGRAAGRKEALLLWLLLMGLALFHLEFRVKLALLLAAVTAGLPAIRKVWKGCPLEISRLRVAAAALAAGAFLLYGVGALHHRRAAFVHLARHGIMGDNGGAKWIGVNEYFQSRTPPGATVIAFSEAKGEGFKVDLSLKTRAGRPMPMGHPAAFYFDFRKLQWWEERARQVTGLASAWAAEDPAGVSRNLLALGSPDYLVVPTERTCWIGEPPRFPYRAEAVIRSFTIYRKTAPSAGGDPAWL